jgi:hypothetical protein
LSHFNDGTQGIAGGKERHRRQNAGTAINHWFLPRRIVRLLTARRADKSLTTGISGPPANYRAMMGSRFRHFPPVTAKIGRRAGSAGGASRRNSKSRGAPAPTQEARLGVAGRRPMVSADRRL